MFKSGRILAKNELKGQTRSQSKALDDLLRFKSNTYHSNRLIWRKEAKLFIKTKKNLLTSISQNEVNSTWTTLEPIASYPFYIKFYIKHIDNSETLF